MVENLPLVTRNYTQIIGLNPGVAQEVNNAADYRKRQVAAKAGIPGAEVFMSQGGTAADNNFEMNGLPINDVQSSRTYSPGVPVPNPDTIQEFKVQTAQYDATSGRNAGADVDVITKGGTNDYHATMFEFFRNEDLNANDWFAKREGHAASRSAAESIWFYRKRSIGQEQGSGSLVPGRAQSSSMPTTHRAINLTILPPLPTTGRIRDCSMLFNGDAGYLGDGSAAASALAPSRWPKYRSSGFGLFNAKLPNGQYVVPTPQSINTCPTGHRGSGHFISEPARHFQ